MKIKKCLTLFLALALVLGSTGGWSARAEEAEDSALAPTLSETAGTAAAAPATLETQPAGEPAFLSHMDGEQFAQADHVARLAGEERLDTYVYLNRDGTKSVYYMGRNVKFVDTDGTVKEKDTTLVSADGGYTMRQNNVNLLLPHNPADGVLLAAGGGGVRLVPQGGSGSAVLEDNAVLYEDYYGLGMSLKYTPMLDGVKEDIILESYSGVSSFSFGLATNGLRLYERNGQWCLAQNATAEAAFRLGEILVYDAVGKPAAGTLTVQEIRTGVYTLTVSAPVAYLTDPTTVYPVTIDPTITSKDTMSTSNIEDATVFSGYPNNNFGNYVFNTIGYQDASYGTGRVAVRLKGLLNDETYQSLSADHIASVQFYMKDGGSNYAYVNIHALTDNSTWTESTVKNSNVGTASETVYDSQRMGGSKWATFDLTDLVKDWKNGNQNGQCGFLMVIADSTKKIGALSCEYGSGDYWPYVVVNYAVSSVLNYTVKDILKGSSFALTADTGGVAAEIAWTSSNTGVATVSSSGVVTGVNAGKAVITASSDVFTEPVSCTVYVTVPDGVYYIKNASSGLCLQGAVSSIGIYEQKTGSENRLNQLWKIHYLGSGYYVIRPMMDFAAALTTNNQGYAAVAAAAVEDDEVAAGARWTIVHNSLGYAFECYGSDTMTLTPVVSGNPGSAVYLGTWSASLSCHWELESAKGIFLRDTSSHVLITSTSVKYMEKGHMNSQIALGVCYEVSGGLSGLSWDTNDMAVVSIGTYSGDMTGVQTGVATITVRATIDGGQYSQSYLLKVRGPVVLYGITNQGHDHETVLSEIGTALTESGWNDVTVRTGSITPETCKSDLMSTSIFISRSHGTLVLDNSSNVLATGIILGDGSAAAGLFSHQFNGMPSNFGSLLGEEDYSNIRVVVFIGCETAHGGAGANNLPTRIVELGADAAIGFSAQIGCVKANQWTNRFYQALIEGKSLKEAAEWASSDFSDESGLGKGSVVICGDSNIVLP